MTNNSIPIDLGDDNSSSSHEEPNCFDIGNRIPFMLSLYSLFSLPLI